METAKHKVEAEMERRLLTPVRNTRRRKRNKRYIQYIPSLTVIPEEVLNPNLTRTKISKDNDQEKQMKGDTVKTTTRKPANSSKCPSGCQSNHNHNSHGGHPTVVIGLIR